MTYDFWRNSILPACPALRCCEPFRTKSRRASADYCSTVEGQGNQRPRNILLGTEHGSSRGQMICIHGMGSNHWDITSDAPLPRLPTLGLLLTCTVAVSMYPRVSVNKVTFPSGGVRHPPFRSFPFVRQQSSPRVTNLPS